MILICGDSQRWVSPIERTPKKERPTRNAIHACRYLMFSHVAYTVGDYMITRLHDYMIFDVDI